MKANNCGIIRTFHTRNDSQQLNPSNSYGISHIREQIEQINRMIDQSQNIFQKLDISQAKYIPLQQSYNTPFKTSIKYNPQIQTMMVKVMYQEPADITFKSSQNKKKQKYCLKNTQKRQNISEQKLKKQTNLGIIHQIHQMNINDYKKRSQAYEQKQSILNRQKYFPKNNVGQSYQTINKNKQKIYVDIINQKKIRFPSNSPKRCIKIKRKTEIEQGQINKIKEQYINNKWFRDDNKLVMNEQTNKKSKSKVKQKIGIQHFVKSMKKFCLINHYLTDKQLQKLYLQVVEKKLESYKWQQQCLKQVYKKIHNKTLYK